jgi:NAD(P)H-flavin reductase
MLGPERGRGAEDLLQVLPGYGTRLHYSAFVSNAADDSGAYPVGFVHEAAQQLHGERLRDLEIYFAGPPAMANAVQAIRQENALVCEASESFL